MKTTIALILLLSLAFVAAAQEAGTSAGAEPPPVQATADEQAEINAPDPIVQTAEDKAQDQAMAASEAPVVTPEELSTGVSSEETTLDDAQASQGNLVVTPEESQALEPVPGETIDDVAQNLELNYGVDSGSTSDASVDIFSDEA